MEEKRISFRFRLNNERDMKAWRILEGAACEKNISKNLALIELILMSESQADNEDKLAIKIADLVADRLSDIGIKPSAINGASEAKVSNEIKEDETEQGADEPEYLGEDAIAFLNAFV